MYLLPSVRTAFPCSRDLCPTGLHPADQLTHYTQDPKVDSAWGSDSSPASPGAPYPPSPTSSHASSQSSLRRDATNLSTFRTQSQVNRDSYSSTGGSAHLHLSATTSNTSTEPDDWSSPQRVAQTHLMSVRSSADWSASEDSRKFSADSMSSNSERFPKATPTDSFHYERHSYGGEFCL